jgi:hypothetical protein
VSVLVGAWEKAKVLVFVKNNVCMWVV